MNKLHVSIFGVVLCFIFSACSGNITISSTISSGNSAGSSTTSSEESTSTGVESSEEIHVHELNHYSKREPTYIRSGCKEYYECTTCDKVFLTNPGGNISEKGIASIDVSSNDVRYISPLVDNQYSAIKYAKAATYNDEGMLPHYRGVGQSNNGKYYDQDFNETTETALKVPAFKNECNDILDDILSADKSTKSSWDVVVNNVNEWSHTKGSHAVSVPNNKAGWQLTKQEYTDIDMKIKINGISEQNPYGVDSYITKAFLIGADASKANGKLPSGYAITFHSNSTDSWLQVYYLDKYNTGDYRGMFIGGIFSDSAHSYNNHEIRIKMRGNVLNAYDTDGRQMIFEEAQLGGFYTTDLVLEKYQGGKVGIFNWTDAYNVDSTFYINEFSGVKKEEAPLYEVKGQDFDSQNTNKRVSVIVLAGQSNMEGNSRAYDDYNTSNYLRNYCNSSGGLHNYTELEEGYSNIKISYHNHFPYGGAGPLGQFGETGYNFSNEVDYSAGKFVDTKIGEGTTTKHFGPELGIAEKIHKNAPNEKVYLIKYGAGGTNFHERGAWSSPQSGKVGILYGGLVQFVYNNLKLIAEEGYIPVIKSLCWMQGESDSNISAEWAENNYQRYLNNMVNDFKHEFGSFAIDNNAGNINFIDGKIYTGANSAWANGDKINASKQAIADSNSHNFVINNSTNYPINGTGYGGGDIYHYDADGALKFGNDFGDIILNNNMLGYTSTPSEVQVCTDTHHVNLVNGYCLACGTMVESPKVDYSSTGEGKFSTDFAYIKMCGRQDFELQFELDISKCYEASSIDGVWAIAGGQNVNSDFYIVTRPDWYATEATGNLYTGPNSGVKISSNNDVLRGCDFADYPVVDPSDPESQFKQWMIGKSTSKVIITYKYEVLTRTLKIEYTFISKTAQYEGIASRTWYKVFVGFGSGTPYEPIYCKIGVHWCSCQLNRLSIRGYDLGYYGHA